MAGPAAICRERVCQQISEIVPKVPTYGLFEVVQRVDDGDTHDCGCCSHLIRNENREVLG